MSNINPKITVVLPVYNADKYLLETLKSISAQDFLDWELIAINDGSTDSSLKILNDYSCIEPRMRIINRENRGLVSTLNEGITLAKGKWIARIDADDICLPNRFRTQLDWLKINDATVCGGGIKRIGDSGKGNSWDFPTTTEGIYAWLLFRPAFAHPTVFIKKEIAQIMPYSKEFTHCEDYELWTRLALNGEPLTNVKETVLLYRIHPEQVSQAKKDTQANVRIKITGLYWQQLSYSRDLTFVSCLVDEREAINKKTFTIALNNLNILESRFNDNQARESIKLHRLWFIYRSLHLGIDVILPRLRYLDISLFKKYIIVLLSLCRATWLINYFRHANWIRHFPLRMFFK